MNEERGSILLSALLFVSAAAVLILGLAAIVRTQSAQLYQIQSSYHTKSMIYMSEQLVLEQAELSGEIKEGTILFNKGKVEVSKQSDTQYTLKAVVEEETILVKAGEWVPSEINVDSSTTVP